VPACLLIDYYSSCSKISRRSLVSSHDELTIISNEQFDTFSANPNEENNILHQNERQLMFKSAFLLQ